MKIACTNCMVPGDTLTHQAENLKKWGFDGMAIQIGDNLRSDDILEQVFGLQEKTGIKICEFSFVGGYFSRHMDTDPEIKRKAIQYFFDSIKICEKIGALTAIGFEYKPRDPLPLFDGGVPMLEDDREEFIRILKLVATEANRVGVPFALEAINRYETRYINNLADCREVIDLVSGDCKVGIIADSFHLSIEEANMPDSIRKSAGYISEVHLGENNRQLPGFGAIDWKSFFRALKEIDYSGYVTLECGVHGDPSVLLQECAAFLKKSMTTA